MLDKYENSYKYIEEFFNIYPLHQLDKEHLANIKELIGKVKLQEQDIKELKKRYYEIDKENTDLFTSLDTAYKENEDLAEEITKLKMYKKAFKRIKNILNLRILYNLNGKAGLCLDGNSGPLGVLVFDINEQEHELLKEVLNE